MIYERIKPDCRVLTGLPEDVSKEKNITGIHARHSPDMHTGTKVHVRGLYKLNPMHERRPVKYLRGDMSGAIEYGTGYIS